MLSYKNITKIIQEKSWSRTFLNSQIPSIQLSSKHVTLAHLKPNSYLSPNLFLLISKTGKSILSHIISNPPANIVYSPCKIYSESHWPPLPATTLVPATIISHLHHWNNLRGLPVSTTALVSLVCFPELAC